jgi:protoporphyrinogen oxidase
MNDISRIDAPLVYETVILGGGISGLVAAQIELNSGSRDVCVIDEYPTIGGNHISFSAGAFTFDIGTIIFQDDSPLMRHFPELLEHYHPIEWSIQRITPANVVRAYPVALKTELVGGGSLEFLRIALSLSKSRLCFRKHDNADQYARYWVGSRFFEQSGLARYIERLYGVPATEIEFSFAEKRMGWIGDAASVKKRLARILKRPATSVPNKSFVRPRNGFADLYEVVQSRMENEGVWFSLANPIRSIVKQDGTFYISTDKRTFVARRVISTIPVSDAYRLCGLGEPPPLRSMTLTSLFFSFQGKRGFDASILYNFSHSGKWKRLTMFSDFYGKGDDHEFLTVEITSRDEQTENPTDLAGEFQQNTRAQHLFDGVLTLVGSHVLRNAYPIYEHGSTSRAATVVGALSEFGIESVGRQGAFDYLPTARQVTLAVENALKGKSSAGQFLAPQEGLIE